MYMCPCKDPALYPPVHFLSIHVLIPDAIKCNGHFQNDCIMVDLEAALTKQMMCFALMCCRVLCRCITFRNYNLISRYIRFHMPCRFVFRCFWRGTLLMWPSRE